MGTRGKAWFGAERTSCVLSRRCQPLSRLLTTTSMLKFQPMFPLSTAPPLVLCYLMVPLRQGTPLYQYQGIYYPWALDPSRTAAPIFYLGRGGGGTTYFFGGGNYLKLMWDHVFAAVIRETVKKNIPCSTSLDETWTIEAIVETTLSRNIITGTERPLA